MTTNQIQTLLLKLQVGWPRTEITDDVIEFYEWGLADVPFEVALEAARRWVRGGKPFFPQPSDLLAIIAKMAIGDVVPEAAWSEIRREAMRHPYGVKKVFDRATNASIPNPGPSFSHPLIAEAVEATGWDFLCRCEDEAEAKKQFTFTLKALAERAMNQTKVTPLTDAAALDGGNVRELRERTA